MDSKVWFWRCQSKKLGYEVSRAQPASGLSVGAPGENSMVLIATRCSRSGNGSGRKRIPSTRVKMAVVAPIPKARVMIVDTANPGLRRSWRKANFASATNVESMAGLWQDQIAVDRTH